MAADSVAAHSASHHHHGGPAFTHSAWWPVAKKVITAAFFVLVVYLVTVQARAVDWDEVSQSVRDYPAAILFGAAGLALLSHALYASYDLISRQHVGHKLSTGSVLTTTFISYAFNLNFGSLIGGLGFRFRLYSRQGLEAGVISRVFGFTMLTNWIGYLLLAGIVCVIQPLAPPEEWPVGSGALRLLGVAFISLAVAYVALCAFSKKRSVSLRGHQLDLPSLRMALLQLAVSCANWMLIGGVAWLLLQHHDLGYPTVLMVMLAAAVAGVITHVPAGIGVLEAVYVTMLSPPVAKSSLLAALLVYRAIYYLVPLVIAIVLFIALELKLKKSQVAAG